MEIQLSKQAGEEPLIVPVVLPDRLFHIDRVDAGGTIDFGQVHEPDSGGHRMVAAGSLRPQ